MADRDRAVPPKQELGDRATDDVAPPDNHGVKPLQAAPRPVEDLGGGLRGSRSKRRVPHRQKTGVERRDAIHVLCGVECAHDGPKRDAAGERQLEDHAPSHARVARELPEPIAQAGRRRAAVEPFLTGHDADPLARTHDLPSVDGERSAPARMQYGERGQGSVPPPER